MITILDRKAILAAGQTLYRHSVISAQEEAGVPIARTEHDIPDGPEGPIMEWMMHAIGRIHQAWGLDVGLVFYHAGIKASGEERALTHLMLGCIGHGVTLADDHADALDRASEWIGRTLDPSPIDLDASHLDELAEDFVKGA